MPLSLTRETIHWPSFKDPRQQVEPRDLETVNKSVLDILKAALARVGEVPEPLLWNGFFRCLPDIRLR